MLNEENLISTLEQSLRQFQNAESRLQERLRKVEAEAEDLKIEIAALQNSAEKTEEALHSLIPTMRSGSKMWKAHKKSQEEEADYQRKSRYEDENDYLRKPRYEEDGYEMPPRRYSSPNGNNQPPPDYRKNSAQYSNNQNNVAPINRNFESRDNRFADRTITQSCTMLLRESSSALHVNELYNLLVAGGFKFTGNNPTISIAVSLNRNRRFTKVAPGTFDLIMREASKAS
ncbi:hypothetical protein BH20ACI1_BH20ACI1_29590 [soil metagenome]